MALSPTQTPTPMISPLPLPVSVSAQTRLLVVAPHPDDETIATGVLIQQVRAAGGEVHILLLTAGDNNPWPQRWLERRLRIRSADRLRWGRRRQAEITQALQKLDVPATAMETFGWPDLGVADILLQPGEAAVRALAAAISRFAPNVVALPALDDRHPDHGSGHVLVRLALAALAGPAEPLHVLAYRVHGQPPQPPFVEVVGTPDQATRKRVALAEHQSQMVLSAKRMRRLADRPEHYVEVSPVMSGPAMALPWHPAWWLQPWLRLSAVSPAGVQQWRWRDAPLQRDLNGVFHLQGTAGHPLFVRLALSLPLPWIYDLWGWCELPPG